MLRLLIPLLFVASVQSIFYTGNRRFSAASPAQIRFAYENKFDDTGPGAKEPEAAYHVFKNLDDALVAYIDDPDTQLPQSEKARAIANLYRSDNGVYYNPQTPKKYSAIPNRPYILPIILRNYPKFRLSNELDFPRTSQKQPEIIRQPPPQWPIDPPAPVKPSMKFGGEYSGFSYQYKPHPDVEFSYDIHDKETGDMKTAQELQDGSGTVHGYFTIMENGGGQSRTVTYESDPHKGYRSIRRIF